MSKSQGRARIARQLELLRLVKDDKTGKYFSMDILDMKGIEKLLTRLGIDVKGFFRNMSSRCYLASLALRAISPILYSVTENN